MASDQQQIEPWLRRVPVAQFAITMGLAGLGHAWSVAAYVVGVPPEIGQVLLLASAIVFAILTLIYLAKLIRFPASVAAEFGDPMQINLFPTFSISLLLLAVAALPYSRTLATILWGIGAGLHLLLAICIINLWITRNVDITHTSPAWFIPVVGNIVVPQAGVPLGFIELSWFFFAIGILFWLVLFTIVLYRIIFHDQLPVRFLPTLFILLAPPALGFTAYRYLTQQGTEFAPLDGISRLLIGMAFFICLLLVSMAGLFRRVPFSLAWWAYTFPSAAMAVAALLYHQALGSDWSAAIAAVVLAAATLIILGVAVRTVRATLGGRLF
ncbi:MAG: SLAC1 anion channel family protein [Pseudomonadota bacterium]